MEHGARGMGHRAASRGSQGTRHEVLGVRCQGGKAQGTRREDKARGMRYEV